MARKKPKDELMPAMAEVEPAVETKPVRLDLPAHVHRRLRRVAADADVSMAAYARSVVEQHLEAEVKRRGIKD